MASSSPEGSIAVDGAIAKEWLRSALGLEVSQSPFPWQIDLLLRFLRGEVVSALDIPTGLGKTAVMAIWLVARARRASVPGKLVYVVDRRAVVDQATEVAESLRAWVAKERAVADALQLGDRPLPISTLRGQHVDNREWLEDPSSPAIVVGTIDMVGSRLLFSGYGVSSKMRPYHAGILGSGTLVVVDEAHLVPAFEDLVRHIERRADLFGPEEPALRSRLPTFSLLSLSATGRQTDSTPLTLTDKDRENEVVKKRLNAKKTLTTVELTEAPDSKNGGDDAAGEDAYDEDKKSKPPSLTIALAKQAWDLTKQGSAHVRCLVFCDARKDATAVKNELQDLAKSANAHDPTVELFVGGRRVRERVQAREALARIGFLAGTSVNLDRSAFLIATSAGEVGVDLDADHMVCDLVAWERMIQRLGRVNRRGDGDANVVIVIEGEPAPPTKKAKEALEEKLAKRDAATRALKERSQPQAKLENLAAELEHKVRALAEQPENESIRSFRSKLQDLDDKLAAVKAEKKAMPSGKRNTHQDKGRMETLQQDEQSLGAEKKATIEELKKAERGAHELLKKAKEQLRTEATKALEPMRISLKGYKEDIKAFKDADAKVVARYEAELARYKALRKLLGAVGEGGSLSPEALLQLRQRQDLTGTLRDATTVEPLRPELTRALVEAWSMTSLDEHPGRPDADPWLRGFRSNDPPQTTVVWRRYLPVRQGGFFDKKAAKRFFEAAPPHTSEQLDTETYVALKWLIERAEAASKEEGEDAVPSPKQVVAIVLTSRGDVKGWCTLGDLTAAKGKGKKESKEDKKVREQSEKKLEDLLIGATLVVDARLGGLDVGLLEEKANNVADAADDSSGTWLVHADAPDVPVTGFRVRPLRTGEQDDTDIDWRTTPGSGWVRRHLFVTEVVDGDPSAALAVDGWVGDAATEDERSEADRPQQLDEHQKWAEECAREIAKHAGLDKKYEDLLALAARLHDEGKEAARWQRAFRAPVDGRPYAKTNGPIDFDILDGYRHELGSLPYVERHAEFLKLPPEDRDFVLHLIAAHHGYARPVIGTSGCDDAPPSIVDERAREVALRFARLSKRWGPWGLAWWEVLLRAADQAASRRNQRAAAAPQKERT